MNKEEKALLNAVLSDTAVPAKKHALDQLGRVAAASDALAVDICESCCQRLVRSSSCHVKLKGLRALLCVRAPPPPPPPPLPRDMVE